jgi:hypothetical protein
MSTSWKEYTERGTQYRIRANIRFDDHCGNGHKSFAITGKSERMAACRWQEEGAGCMHDEIANPFK